MAAKKTKRRRTKIKKRGKQKTRNVKKKQRGGASRVVSGANSKTALNALSYADKFLKHFTKKKKKR